MSDEHKPESESDNDNSEIEGKGFGASLRIPVRRSDIGPYIKWLILAISLSVVILAIGGVIALVK